VKDEIDFVTTLPAHEIYWRLINSFGKVIKEKHEENIPDGIFAAQIDITDILPGMYFLSFSSGNESVLKKVMVVK
jgi:hypothetical protein